MSTNLIELRTNELLAKFGAGSHKPGSGSAAAFQGLLSAQLIRTVSTLTCNKPTYSNWHEVFSDFLSEIEHDIYPRLERLFQDDSVQFGKVFDARNARDEAKGSSNFTELANKARNELKPATAMPIEIGQRCLRLAEIALSVFDNGFQAARGDTGVALNGALSAVAGSISIIDLNLLSFGSDSWTSNVRDEVSRLRLGHAQLSSEANFRLEQLKAETDQIATFYQKFEAFRRDVKTRNLQSNKDVEDVARQLQGAIWKNHKLIWKKLPPENLIELLKPEKILELLGYDYEIHATLGQHEINGSLVEVAGQIDNGASSVAISSQFPPDIRNFTVAHELGHALMHQQDILHRDRALDGTTPIGSRDKTERQADKFATYFLMPEQLVRDRFYLAFSVDQFQITADTAFALNYNDTRELRKKAASKKGLSEILATAELYNGNHFRSLAEQFGVSKGAMAIRLDELELFTWD